jgi:alkanesulfonate monooxygenase SsuD/methylene tetrahydromethanopterin reductase-like flavin-dependent oxidoreductase (luciferase family)
MVPHPRVYSRGLESGFDMAPEPRLDSVGADMDIGIFDHLDRRDMPLDEFYESRLRLLERYDAAGFYSYHLAEHHATPLGLAPSPGIFIAAATQRTRHIRLGPCVYCLPLYDPLRLIEEVCMLDQLSRGRFDFGVGRGIVPYEMAHFNLHHLETEEIYKEGLEVILQGLQNEVLEHRGPRYTYRKVPMILRPYQKPHPPLWYGLSHLAGAEWAAANKVHVLANGPCDATLPLFQRYRDAWQRTHGGAPMPKLGIGRHVVVAPSDGEGEAIARPAYAAWYANLTKLWRDFGALPIRFARDFDEARARGIAVAGTPRRVREELEGQIPASGCTYLVCRLMFGGMSEAEAAVSIDLFTAEVMPYLAKLAPR